jgi:hypothetical protein
MRTNAIAVAPARPAIIDSDELSPPFPLPTVSAVVDALASARDLLPDVEYARAAQAALVLMIDAEAARQSRWTALPPLAAAVLSAAAAALAAILAARYAPLPYAAGRFGAIALIADIAALGALVAIAFRRSADRSRRRPGRLAWLTAGLAALAGLATFGIDGAAASGNPGILPAVAAAVPWLFARLATRENARLADERNAASSALAGAEDRANQALLAARDAFDAEVASIAEALAGDRPDARVPGPWRDRRGSLNIVEHAEPCPECACPSESRRR